MSNYPAFNLPLNQTSLGQVSTSILKEVYSRNINPILFPIGEVNLSSEEEDPNFNEWLKDSILRSYSSHNRSRPIFKLWHLNGSLESFSEKQILLSFYELDSPTDTEINIARNNSKVYFSSNYTVDIFKACGCNNVEFLPLYFDKNNFSKTTRQGDSSQVRFGLFGKLEPSRKRHLKTLKAWANKFGNDPRYSLNCAIYNNFLDPKVQSEIISQALDGKQYWNINFVPFLAKNKDFNQFLNNIDIVLAMSGGEGWGLPEFHSVAIGKHCVGLNAHAYKDWLNDDNSILINPSSKIDVYDNIFFKQGLPFNQGRIFDWSEEDFNLGVENVLKKFESHNENSYGLELQQKFTVTSFVDKILTDLS